MATALTSAMPNGTTSPRRRLPGSFWLMSAALALMLPTYAYPMLQLLAESLDAPAWSGANYASVFNDPAFWPVLSRTFVMSGQITLLCGVIGYPVAYAMLRAPARWRALITLAVVLPLWTSTLVRSYAWVIILGQDGVINQLLSALGLSSGPIQFLYTRFAILIGFVQVMLPYFVFPLHGVMSRIDLRLVTAAESIGASPLRAFLGVFFPLSLPGVASGAILIFILTLGFFVTPTLLGGLHEITYVMLIERQVNTLLNWNMAAAMSVVFLIFTALIVALASRFLGFSAGDRTGTRSVDAAWLGRLSIWLATRFVRPGGERIAASASGTRARRRMGWGLRLYVIAVVAFILLPITLFFPLGFSDAPYLVFPPTSFSLRWYTNYFNRPDWMAATWMSLQVAITTMIIATLVGGAAAVGLSRARFRGSNLILGFLLSPMVVPHLIIAVGLYFQLSRLRLVGTATGLVLSHLVLALPIVIVVLLNALKNIDLMPEQAARSLGAGPLHAFLRTTLVAIRPSVVAAALFAFLASFEDVIMALFMSGATASTLPKRMWDSIVLEIDPTVAAVSSLMIVISTALFLLAQLSSRGARRPGSGSH
jgi:putative spermidine/putrescine transport system permease protein